jgi:hypothetical protein
VEWCTLAAIALFLLGIYLTASDEQRGSNPDAPQYHPDE